MSKVFGIIVTFSALLASAPAYGGSISRGDQAAYERQEFLSQLLSRIDKASHPVLAEALETAQKDPDQEVEAIHAAMRVTLAATDWQPELNRIRQVFSLAQRDNLLHSYGTETSSIHIDQFDAAFHRLANKAADNEFDEHFLLGYLALADVAEAMPFRSLPDGHRLREQAYNVTASQWQAVQAFIREEPAELVADLYQTGAEEWQQLKENLAAANLEEQIDALGLQVQALIKAFERDETDPHLLPNHAETAIRDAAKLIEHAKAAITDNQSTDAAILYSTSLRRLFPGRVLYTKNERELTYLMSTRNTLFYLKRYVGEDVRLAKGRRLYRALADTADETAFQKAAAQFSNWFKAAYEEAELYQLLPYISPRQAAEQTARLLESLAAAMPHIKERFREDQTYVQSWQSTYNEDVEFRLDQVRRLASTNADILRTTNNLDMIAGYYQNSHVIESMYGYFSEAVLMRYSSVGDYYEALATAFTRMGQNRNIYSDAFTKKLRDLMDQDTFESKLWRAYLTRQNLVTVAVAAVLIAEAVTFQWQAVPATLAFAAAAGKVVIVTNSALNLLDRHHREGWVGLANVQSAIDALIVVSLLPRATPQTITTGSWASKTGQFLRNRWALFQHSTGQTMVWLVGGMGAYEIIQADAIAQDMRAKGHAVSADDIRKRGIRNVAMALVLHLFNRNAREAGIEKHGEAAANGFKRLNFTQSNMYQRLRSANPWGGFRYFRHQVAQRWAASPVLGKVDAAWFAVTVPAMNYLLVNEAILYSYTTPDFTFDRHVETAAPWPALRQGESALLAIGFDAADLLYAGANSYHFQRQERIRYGDNFHTTEFSSPEDFFRKLRSHAEQHGPIRYLKVAAHGLPGMIATRASLTSPTYPDPDKGYFDHLGEPGYISINFLKENLPEYTEIMAETFAPDARIIIVSCLVGSNYDSFEFGDDVGVADQGDQFLDLLSETLLVNGGRLDASRRILLGLNMVFGALLAAQHQGAIAEESLRTLSPREGRGVIPLTLFQENSSDQTGPRFEAASPEIGSAIETELKAGRLLPSQWMRIDQSDTHQSLEQLAFSAQRLQGMILNLHNVWWRYGLKLDGPFWEERFNFRIVEP